MQKLIQNKFEWELTAHTHAQKHACVCVCVEFYFYNWPRTFVQCDWTAAISACVFMSVCVCVLQLRSRSLLLLSTLFLFTLPALRAFACRLHTRVGRKVAAIMSPLELELELGIGIGIEIGIWMRCDRWQTIWKFREGGSQMANGKWWLMASECIAISQGEGRGRIAVDNNVKCIINVRFKRPANITCVLRLGCTFNELKQKAKQKKNIIKCSKRR